MDARIVEFAEVLRQNGLRVGTSEVADALQAVSAVGVESRERFRAALRATLCKRSADQESFSKAFDFFFSGAAAAFQAIDKSLLQALEEQGLLAGDDLQRVVETIHRLYGQMSPLAQAVMQGDRGRLAQILRGASLQLDLSQMETALQTGFFSRRMMGAAGGEKMRSDLEALEAELKARGVSPQGLEIVSQNLGAALRKVEDAVRRQVADQAKARLRKSEGTLAERNFHSLSKAEIAQAQTAVRKLAEKIKSRLVRRRRTRRKGQLNVRRTLRRNLSWGGIPMVPQFRSRRPERPDVVVLCDVSDSVRNTARMMLLFTHTLQSLFTRVRSFVFVSDVGEVTQYFKELEVEEAIDLATAGRAISLHSNSNYGRALANFVRAELGSVTRRTTVMVIGDGRNNYNEANGWALADLRRKCRRLLWICTEDERNWGFGDSEMKGYARHCHQVLTVQSLADLERVATHIVPY